jgi:hypothetical protein
MACEYAIRSSNKQLEEQKNKLCDGMREESGNF